MTFCFDAVSTKRKIVAINPRKNEYLFDLSNSLAWLAALQQNNKKFDFAIKLLEEQLNLNENIVLNDSKNAMGQYMLAVSKTALAEAIINKNGIKDDKSLKLLNSSIEILDKIDSIDVSDSSRRSLRTRIIILKTKNRGFTHE
jgi:tetratricopeptide (TPR) repeat protein